jgi:ABC-2 type transport system ATP-binding protein
VSPDPRSGAPASPVRPVIEARGLSRRFGSLLAVDGVDLDVGDGEVFGFLGPNGAGKSTLIRMLVGLLAPSGGSVRVLGCDLPRHARAVRARLGYMTQRFSLYDDLTVEENLDFAAEVFGVPPGERSERVAAALLDYDLDERSGERPAHLSGGWRQRLALAASTIHRPELLVLDEPTAGVDPERRRVFWEKIFELAGRGTTVLVSTHYMDEAVRCHRLSVLRRGRQVALGTPHGLTRALEGRVLEVLTSSAEAAIEHLRRLPEILSATQLGSRIHLLLRPEADARLASRVRDALRGAGLEGRCEPTEPSLEDVFVAIIRGERLAEPAAV